MTRALLLPVLCLYLFLLPIAEVQCQSAVQDTVAFTSKRKSVRIPFKLIHNLIVIPLKINDSSTMNFILDSGVRNTLITRLYYSDSLNLNETNKVSIQGLGTGYSMEAIYSTGNTLHMKNIKGINHKVYVLLEDVFNLSMRMGMPVHGIIGYDIFKNFIVKVNYSNNMLTLYRPDAKIKLNKRAEIYPLEIDGNKAYIYADVKQYNGEKVKVKLVIDTGASNSISLYLPTNKQLALPPKVLEAYIGRGLSGDISGKIGRISGISLGKYELEHLPVSYPDEEAIQLAINISNRNGNIGGDILKRFTVIFDYPHNQMVLLPNNKFKSPFHYNLAGFEVSTPLPGSNLYIISNVVQGSPADKLGLAPGDQLLNINGVSCTDLSLNDILGLLESRPGRKLKIKMKRNHITFNVELVLQNKI